MDDTKKTKAQLMEELGAERCRADELESGSSDAAAPSLLEGEPRYQQILDRVPDIIYELTADGMLLYANERAFELLGIDRNGFGVLQLTDVVHSEDVQRGIEALAEMVRTGQSNRHQPYRLKTVSGDYLPVEASAIVLEHGGGTPTILGIARDVSERLETEKALQASESRYRELFETINEAILSAGPDGRIIAANPAAARMLGYDSPQEMIGTPGAQIYFDNSCGAALVSEMVNQSGVRNREIIGRRRDGSLVHMLGNFYVRKDASGKPVRYDGILLDISERKKAENAARETDRIMRAMLEASPDMVVLLDAEARIIAANEKAEAALRYRTNNPIGQCCYDVVPSRMREERKPKIERAISTGKPVYFQDEWGGRYWETYIEPFLDKDGRVKEVAVFTRDITERKLGEQRLREAKENLDHAQRIAQLGSWSVNPITFETTWSEEMYRIHGLPVGVSPPITEQLLERFHPDDRVEFTTVFSQALASGGRYSHEMRFRRWGDEEERIHRVVGEIVRGSRPGDVRVVGTTMDITNRLREEREKEELYEQLNQAQRLEAIGRLAGGVAHDFNNILMGVVGGATILKRHLQEGTPLFEKAVAIERAAEQAVLLTNQLLAFARGGKYQPLVQDLNDIVRQAIDFLPTSMKKRVVVRKRLADKLPPVEADRTQIIQIVTNLCFNAEEAMNRQGEVHIETFLPDRRSLPESLRSDNARFVALHIWDTGPGIPEEIRRHIFDPFYTSKGYGRGLGLSAVYGIVRNHHGVITCGASPTGGASFAIYLPASEEVFRPEGTSVQTESGEARQTTVLVVDDDRTSRQIIVSMLESIGYRALSADSGKVALDLFRNNLGRIDLVLLDVLMPGMDGKEAWHELIRIDPEIGVIFMSGFVSESFLPAGTTGRGTAFIQKPFDLKKLGTVIQKYLSVKP